MVSIGPSSLSTFTQQVAGHKGEDQMLLDESGRSIFKPLNRQEARFYDLLKTHLTSPSFPAHFFPGFLGTTNHNGRGASHPHDMILLFIRIIIYF